MPRLRDKVRKQDLVVAYKIMECWPDSKTPNSPYVNLPTRPGKWYGIEEEENLCMCSVGFHTIPTLAEAIKVAEAMHDRYHGLGSRAKTVVFECFVSVPEQSKRWAPFSSYEDGPWPSDELVTTKQLSRYQKLNKVVYTAKGKKKEII